MKNIYMLKQYHQNHGQICLGRKGYQNSLLVLLDANTLGFITDTHRGEKYSPLSSLRTVSATNLQRLFGFSYQKNRNVGMKLQALKAKERLFFLVILKIS